MKKISIKGIEYPCRITMGAMIRFKQETGHDVSKMAADDMTELITFFWCCTKSACNADNVQFPYDLMSFADAIDPSESNAFLASIGEQEQKDSKKKSPST